MWEWRCTETQETHSHTIQSIRCVWWSTNFWNVLYFLKVHCWDMTCIIYALLWYCPLSRMTSQTRKMIYGTIIHKVTVWSRSSREESAGGKNVSVILQSASELDGVVSHHLILMLVAHTESQTWNMFVSVSMWEWIPPVLFFLWLRWYIHVQKQDQSLVNNVEMVV